MKTKSLQLEPFRPLTFSLKAIRLSPQEQNFSFSTGWRWSNVPSRRRQKRARPRRTGERPSVRRAALPVQAEAFGEGQGAFLNSLGRTAEQLSVEAVWAVTLSATFVKWLRGKVLQPVSQGGQMLLQLTT